MTDEDLDILIGLIAWPLILGVAFWYVRRKKHPNRGVWSALGIFLGIFGGALVAGIAVLVWIWHLLGLEETGMPGAVTAVFALAVIIPAWRYAVGKIQQPPGSSRSE